MLDRMSAELERQQDRVLIQGFDSAGSKLPDCFLSGAARQRVKGVGGGEGAHEEAAREGFEGRLEGLPSRSRRSEQLLYLS